MTSNKEIIEQHIINEVRKYAKQKKLLLELSNIYPMDVLTLENKPIEELVNIYKKTVECLHKLTDHTMIVGNYVRLLQNTIMKKHILEKDIVTSDDEV